MKTKHAPQTALKIFKKLILLAITALALSASSGSRGDHVCNQLPTAWTYSGTAGSWFDSSNWCDGVPLCAFPACISNGGTAQINSTDPAASACETFLGHFECFGPLCQGTGQSSGSLFVDGGTLQVCNWMHVGYQGTGNLKITDGGLVSSIGADIATGVGSYGGVSVDGPTSLWTVTGDPGVLYVGGTSGSTGGTGLLTVTNGGKASAASVYVYKSGTVAGNGTVDVTNGTTSIEGTLAPNWTLTITGNLTFEPNTTATMQCNVTPQNSGNDAEVLGTAALDDKLSVIMTGDFTHGPNRFTLLHAGTLDGTFRSQSITYPTDQGFTPKIDYVGNYVYLDLVFNQN